MKGDRERKRTRPMYGSCMNAIQVNGVIQVFNETSKIIQAIYENMYLEARIKGGNERERRKEGEQKNTIQGYNL